MLVSGCGKEAPKTSPAAEEEGLTRTATDGPVTLKITVRPADLAFNQRAELIVEASAEKGVTVDLTDYERGLEGSEHQFEYRVLRGDRRVAEPTPDGKLRWTQRYSIEFFLPGEYELPPATLTYVDARAAAGSATPPPSAGARPTEAIASGTISPHELKTEAIKVVARATEEATLSPEELKKIAVLPPVELPDPWSRWWLLAPVGVLAAVGFLIWFAHRLRFESVAPVVVIPAHEWARRQFAALVAADLIARGHVQEFYYRISAVVRGYIERRFDVSAPEMTTEEFLAAAARDQRFDAAATLELRRFLTACDLVKYARHRPAPGEWDELLKTASDFVERTRGDSHEVTPISSGQAPPRSHEEGAPA